MSSMYETIMELPLFKGIGEEQLSQMLEKTSVDFHNFKHGEIIAAAHHNVKTVDFILNGKVRQIFHLSHKALEVEETLGEGSILGGTHLFGMDTTYSGDIIADGKVSLMRIEKSEYMNVLQSNRIYMLNLVNYLSAASQRCSTFLMTEREDAISMVLRTVAYSLTSRKAEKIVIKSTSSGFAEYCGVGMDEFERWKNKMVAKGRFEACDEGLILK